MNQDNDWDEFFALLEDAEVPRDFLSMENRKQVICARDPFEGWEEPPDNSDKRNRKRKRKHTTRFRLTRSQAQSVRA
ncbi:MAG: hypothetical protein QOG58_947 [Caballeronia sp.]|jgi:hypothetical protein|nr:hypothetical protein [Caballeronia sp.]